MGGNSFFARFMGGSYDVECQLDYFLRKNAEEHLKKQAARKEEIHTQAQAEERKKEVEKAFLEAIGGLETERAPLKAQCVGILVREGYEIRKIIFESLPRFYVTANLYMPSGKGEKYPGIVMACGHGELGKASPPYQKVCIDLVKYGFVVLIVDPTGQGERMSFYDVKAERSLLRPLTTEHSYQGLQCQLTGSSIDRYFIWDLIRALDYLAALAEVDSGRIGMTGNSGGGGQTLRMMLLEPRIKAAAACCYPCSHEYFLKTPLVFDGERNTHGAISRGINDDDFYSCFAPKPVMMGAAQSDYFGIEGVLVTYERARRIYELYGCPEALKLVVGPGTHGYSAVLREAAVNWFRQHLKQEAPDFKTGDPVTEDPEVLLCTKSGNVYAEYGDARGVFEINADYMEKHKYASAADPREIKSRIEALLRLPALKAPIYPRFTAVRQEGGKRYQNLFFFSEEDILVNGVFIDMPERPGDCCTLLLMDNGTDDIPLRKTLVEKLLKKGDVLVFDPRAVGASKSRYLTRSGYSCMFGTEHKLNGTANMMGSSLLGMRIFDVLRAVELLKEVKSGRKIALAGYGLGVLYGVFAMALSDEIRDVYLENGLPSFESLVRNKNYDYHPVYDLFGILRHADIPMILEAFSQEKQIQWAVTPQIAPDLILDHYNPDVPL